MRSVSGRLSIVVAAAIAISCGTISPSTTAIEVVITIAPESKSVCVIVEAGTQRTDPLPLNGRSELKVGVVRTDKMPASIPVVALGYSNADCTARTVPTEQSDVRDAAFEGGKVVTVELRLAPVTGPTDGDGDGSAVPDDCNDANPAIHPGATELCTGGVDEDCDGLVDCADSDCSGKSCGTGAACGTGACRETACADGIDNDLNEGLDCADPDCAGKPCLNGGTCTAGSCQGATSEVGLCADGQDNDGDNKIDCADSDCAGLSCSDSNLCTTGETCQGTGCLGGTAVACSTQGPICTLPNTGACQQTDGGCAFTLSPADAGCDDKNLCTVNDTCNGDGGCVGLAVQCLTPPSSCHLPTGVCQSADGGCAYALRTAGTGFCDDGNSCTNLDTCDGDGGCKGTQITCPAIVCGTFAGTCGDAGTCNYNPTPGVACDGGTCNAQGLCAPPSPWPYTTSNFLPAEVPTPSAAVVINCNTAAIRTSTTAPYAVFEGWCAAVPQPTFALGVSTATAPVLLSMLGLTVNNNMRLRVYGTRPAILAVQGNVQIDGALEAGARADVPGAGGNADCPAGARPTVAVSDTTGGGGGGAGFGTAGRDGGLGESGARGGVFGAAWGSGELLPLVGGCSGALGGSAVETILGGGGGGALQISASGSIAVTDNISSVGGGGRDPLNNQMRGGGGGGSGGAILLEAQSFSLAGGAFLSCNGGAGGEGSDGNSNPDPGADGSPTSTTAAPGGNAANNGGNGGNGATSTTAATNGGNGTSGSEHGGGGGGGAGLGRVRINVTTSCTRAGTFTAVTTSKLPDGGTCP